MDFLHSDNEGLTRYYFSNIVNVDQDYLTKLVILKFRYYDRVYKNNNGLFISLKSQFEEVLDFVKTLNSLRLLKSTIKVSIAREKTAIDVVGLGLRTPVSHRKSSLKEHRIKDRPAQLVFEDSSYASVARETKRRSERERSTSPKELVNREDESETEDMDIVFKEELVNLKNDPVSKDRGKNVISKLAESNHDKIYEDLKKQVEELKNIVMMSVQFTKKEAKKSNKIIEDDLLDREDKDERVEVIKGNLKERDDMEDREVIDISLDTGSDEKVRNSKRIKPPVTRNSSFKKDRTGMKDPLKSSSNGISKKRLIKTKNAKDKIDPDQWRESIEVVFALVQIRVIESMKIQSNSFVCWNTMY